jgi:penicillin-binding protein 1A
MLKDVIKRGTGIQAKKLGRSDIAGKTGTTNGPRDAWFSGYSPHLVASVWLGFDQNTLLGRREFGSSAALPIWMDFMRIALDGKPDVLPRQPDGIVTVRVNPATGLPAQPDDENAIFEIFKAEDANRTAASSAEEADQVTLPEELF